MREYEYYIYGCRALQEQPVSLLTFKVAYSLYQRHFYDAVDFDLQTGEIRLRKGYFHLIPWARLRKLARTVDRGRELAQSRPSDFGSDDESGGPGVREPRRPIAPTLIGATGRSLTSTPVFDYDRSMLH